MNTDETLKPKLNEDEETGQTTMFYLSSEQSTPVSDTHLLPVGSQSQCYEQK